MTYKTKSAAVLLGALLVSTHVSTHIRAEEAPKVAKAPDYRLFMMGNSLTDQINFGAFSKMVESSGQKLTLARQTIPGAPIGWILNHPDQGFVSDGIGGWKKAFENHQWDGLSLQPFQWGYNENIRDIPKILDEYYKKSPQGDVFIYAQWPGWDKGGDWTRRWLEPRAQNIMSRQEYEDTVTWVRENIKERKPARLVPVGHVMHLLEQKAKAGTVPGLKTMWNVYDDGVHLNNVGSFIVGTTFYATVFKKSPEGLDFSPYKEGRMPITPELAKAIQQTAWEVVATHPMTGVSSTRLPQIATPILDHAVQGSDYSGEIFAAFGKAPRAFKLKSGKIPAGMTLSKDGILSGAPTVAGDAKFEVQVTDAAGKSAARAMTLKVVPDSTPEIALAKFPALQQGIFQRLELKAKSDNAPLFWKVEKGELPIGMSFNDGGVLEGTPGRAGNYEVTLAVTDGDSSGPETTTKTFNFTVAPAGKDVFFARRVDWKPEPNGKLDEREKWQFTTPVSKVLTGAINDAAPMIDVVYDNESLYVAVMVKDKNLVGQGWSLGEKDDQVIIYFDGKNNREAVYNWDDLRFNVNANGGKKDIRGGWWAYANVGKVDGGYLVESRVNWSATGQMLRGDNRDWLSVGVDVHVLDVDAENGEILSRVAWHGTAKNDTDPSGYRTVIMRPDAP